MSRLGWDCAIATGSPCDSETLVAGLAQRGPALLLELRGTFAFAAYDHKKQQLLLARDRLGIKPLYLSWKREGLIFSSDYRSLPNFNRYSPQSISQFLAFGYQHTPTQFCGSDSEDIVSLPPGMVVRINLNRPHIAVRYWPPQPRPDWSPLPIRSHDRSYIFLREQLQEVVDQQLMADGPVSCMLSPGVYSGILSALASRQQPGQISTFTVALPGSSDDSLSYSRQMARHCRSDHHELEIKEDSLLPMVQHALAVLDAPTASGIKTYLISRVAAEQGIRVALSGTGADQLFGKKPSHRLMPLLNQLRHLHPRVRHGLLRRISPRLALMLSDIPYWDRWYLSLAMRRIATVSDLNAAGADSLYWPKSPVHRITQAWGQTSWAELFGYTEPLLLREYNSMNIAFGIEWRMPFLDHHIVEIALRMPQRFHKSGKGLLLQSCADLFPPDYLHIPKQRFDLPMNRWMCGPLRELCLVRIAALQATGWLDPSWIDLQWQAFTSGNLHWSQAWSLVVLGEFARRNLYM